MLYRVTCISVRFFSPFEQGHGHWRGTSPEDWIGLRCSSSVASDLISSIHQRRFPLARLLSSLHGLHGSGVEDRVPSIHVSLLRTAAFGSLCLSFLAAFWSGLERRESVPVRWMTASLLHSRQHLWKACTWFGAIDIGCAWFWLGLHLTEYMGLVLHGG